MDFTAPITVWTGSTYKAYSIADDNYALRPMQGFFVQKPEAVDEIIFHKEGRQVTAQITHPANLPQRTTSQTQNRKIYNLSITSASNMMDETRVVINPTASLSYELTRDAAKFMSMDLQCPVQFSQTEENPLYQTEYGFYICPDSTLKEPLKVPATLNGYLLEGRVGGQIVYTEGERRVSMDRIKVGRFIADGRKHNANFIYHA